MTFGFDIETTPNVELIEATFDKQEFVDTPFKATDADGKPKWAKQETIDRKRKEWEDGRAERLCAHERAEAERLNEAIYKSLLDATRCKILCISYYDDERGFVDWGDGDNEREMLERFWKIAYACQRRNGRMYSASGSQFDIRMIWRRSLALSVERPASCQVLSWKSARPMLDRSFVDVCEVWAAGEYGRFTKVQHLAEAFGVAGKHTEDGISGKEFWRYAMENRKTAEQYAIEDARIAYQVGRKMEEAGVWISTGRDPWTSQGKSVLTCPAGD